MLKKLFLVIICIAMIVSIGLMGCKSTTAETTAAETTVAAVTETTVVETTAAKKDLSKVKIAYIPMNTGNPYFNPIIDGFKKAAEELGFELIVTAPDSADPTAQIPYIEAQIQQGVDAICLSPNSVDAMNLAFQKALDKNIKVLTVNSDITGSEKYRLASVIPTNFDKLPILGIQEFAKLMNYEGDWAYLSATTDAPFQNMFMDVANKELKDPKYSKMKLVATAYGDDDPQKSLTEAEALLQTYTNLKGIASPTTVGAAAAAQAIENAGMNDKTIMWGLCNPNLIKDFLKSGACDGAMLWDGFRTGYVAAYYTIGLITGEYKAEEGFKFTVEKYGEITVEKNNQIFAGPPLSFTKDNVGDYNF